MFDRKYSTVAQLEYVCIYLSVSVSVVYERHVVFQLITLLSLQLRSVASSLATLYSSKIQCMLTIINSRLGVVYTS